MYKGPDPPTTYSPSPEKLQWVQTGRFTASRNDRTCLTVRRGARGCNGVEGVEGVEDVEGEVCGGMFGSLWLGLCAFRGWVLGHLQTWK
jgi:hypothetical protein